MVKMQDQEKFTFCNNQKSDINYIQPKPVTEKLYYMSPSQFPPLQSPTTTKPEKQEFNILTISIIENIGRY